MILRGIDFGKVWAASGAQGFFNGREYWYHKLLYGLKFLNEEKLGKLTFVAKTTTLSERQGNMPLHRDLRPTEIMPKCIIIKPFKGVVLNAVGLSGIGIENLLNRGLWQRRQKPFFISFMSVAGNFEDRIYELISFVNILKSRLPEFQAPIGLQMNFSCPNVGLDPEKLIGEVEAGLDVAVKLDVPLVPKFNLCLPPIAAKKISKHPACGSISVSNTIPWGQMPDRINWKKIFGSDKSPLAHLGGGGLSGKPLLPILIEWVKTARRLGLNKPINAGGGILSADDARLVFKAGADSISLGSIFLLRPWNIGKIINRFS
jgi:dihydroorotate dehydrogenase